MIYKRASNRPHLFRVRVHLHSRLRLHPSPLFPDPGDVPICRKSAAECAIDLLPGEGLHRGRGRVDFLVLDRVHVVLDQGKQSVLLLGDPILRPLPLLQQHRSRFRGHAPFYKVNGALSAAALLKGNTDFRLI